MAANARTSSKSSAVQPEPDSTAPVLRIPSKLKSTATVARRSQRFLSADAATCVRVFGEVANDSEFEAEQLTAADVDEIRSLKSPPGVVRRILEVVHLVLHCKRHPRGVPRDGVKWEAVLRTLAAEDLVQRLQAFDVGELRQNPTLARDLHEVYFSTGYAGSSSRSSRRSTTYDRRSATHDGGGSLNPERVRRASTAAVALFSWAARTVEDAVPPPVLPHQLDAPELVEIEELPELPEVLKDSAFVEDAEFVAETRLTVGVWACCPQGHGLTVFCAVQSPTCAMCGNNVARGADSASCRPCNFFVCQNCRGGSWLTLSFRGAAGSTRTNVPVVPTVGFEVVGFRWLREGDEFPPPIVMQNVIEQGAVAFWGRQSDAADEAAELLGDDDGRIVLGLSSFEERRDASANVAANCELEATVGWPSFSRRGAVRSPTKGSSIFGLTDSRALGAAVIIGICGRPGGGGVFKAP